MGRPWRLLTLAAGLSVSVGVRAAMCQTVVVRGAAPGTTVELMLNASQVGAATADAGGDATLTFSVAASLNKSQTDVHVFVDTCGNLRRVLVVESGRQPPAPEGACDRRGVPDLFVVRAVTTFVVEVGGLSPVVWIRQGPAPTSWLGRAGS